MPTALGLHSPRLTRVRALQTVKGRREHGLFAFEGATLLGEAERSGLPLEELYVTKAAFEANPALAGLEASGVPLFLVDDRAAAKLSDVETPSGIVAVAALRIAPIEALLAAGGVVAVLADLNDPGNAGTLVRSAEAFGCAGIAFGSLGVDPFHPKVVRAAMGSLFRLRTAVAEPADLAAAAAGAGFEIAGLSSSGEPLESAAWTARNAVVIGHERHGLGRWERVCGRLLAIEMSGRAESLNAAVAGSIALYRAASQAPREGCQESVRGAKSQDYPR